MAKENKNIILILLALAMFTGMAIEISEGSTAIGVLLFLSSAFLLTKINFQSLGNSNILNKSKIFFIVGIFVLTAVFVYNYKNRSELGTLDVMASFFGISLIGARLQNPQINRVSTFGAYISSVFIVLYLIFYSMFGFFNINFMHNFDHYLILLPTVGILNLIGIPLEVIATETVRISGVEEMVVVIGGPCSGLYSMFLLIGIVFGYSRVENMKSDKTLIMLGFCVVVAYISNLFRVIVLYLTAYIYGQETMMMVHTHAGWIIFAAVAAGIMYFIEVRR